MTMLMRRATREASSMKKTPVRDLSSRATRRDGESRRSYAGGRHTVSIGPKASRGGQRRPDGTVTKSDTRMSTT